MKQLLAATSGRGYRASSYNPFASESHSSFSSRRETSVMNTGGYTTTSTTVRSSITSSNIRASETMSSSRRYHQQIYDDLEEEAVAPILQTPIDAPIGLCDGDSLTLEARFRIAEPTASITWSINGEVSNIIQFI